MRHLLIDDKVTRQEYKVLLVLKQSGMQLKKAEELASAACLENQIPIDDLMKKGYIYKMGRFYKLKDNL